MNETETTNTLLNHRSIRHFKDQPLPESVVLQLLNAAHHAASSMFLQQYSVISITDNAVKQQLADISGQPHAQHNGHLFIFVADQYRNYLIGREQHANIELLGETDRLLGCVYDATIAAQSLVVAAESLGLGTVYLGSILNEPRQVIDCLKLPHLTFPLFAVAVGYPNSQPEQKPRLPLQTVHFNNHYQLPTDFNSLLDHYDQDLAKYYESRTTNSRHETFRNLITHEIARSPKHRRDLFQVLQEQGFLTNQR